MAKLRQVIETLTYRGDGTRSNPSRNVLQFFDVDGELLVERDEWDENDKNDRLRRVYCALHETLQLCTLDANPGIAEIRDSIKAAMRHLEP